MLGRYNILVLTDWEKSGSSRCLQIKKLKWLIKEHGIKPTKNAYQKSRSLIVRQTTKDIARLGKQPCIYCGTIEDLSIEHVVPIHRGGTHGIGNLASACKTCNSSKNKRFITEWRKRNANAGMQLEHNAKAWLQNN